MVGREGRGEGAVGRGRDEEGELGPKGGWWLLGGCIGKRLEEVSVASYCRALREGEG